VRHFTRVQVQAGLGWAGLEVLVWVTLHGCRYRLGCPLQKQYTLREETSSKTIEYEHNRI
jgi:hypothetical protein